MYDVAVIEMEHEYTSICLFSQMKCKSRSVWSLMMMMKHGVTWCPVALQLPLCCFMLQQQCG